MMRRLRGLGYVAASAAPGLWAGMILGAAFIAVPAVFRDAGFGKPFAYGAAARVFESLAEAEWLFAVILLLGLALLGFPQRRMVAAVMLLALLATQAIWLRPELTARAEILAMGGAVEPSADHAINAVLEIIKLAWLAGLAYAGLKAPDPGDILTSR